NFAAPVLVAVAEHRAVNDVDLNLTGRSRIDAMRRLLAKIQFDAEEQRSARAQAWKSQSYHVFLILYIAALAMGIIIGLFTHDRMEAVSSAFLRSLEKQEGRAEER